MNREQWLEWRKLGIGASDAAVIMGVSPWSTPYLLWKDKLCIDTRPNVGNWATKRGNELEPAARALYELETGREMPPILCIHAEHDWLRASLDGYNAKDRIVLEIKCPGAADHNKALCGEIPEKYYPQLQHQLMVTGATCVHYYSYDGSDGCLIEVSLDPAYIERLFLAEQAFWQSVIAKVPPELTPKDQFVIRTKYATDLATQYQEAVLKAAEAQSHSDALKAELIALTKGNEHPKFSIGAVNITKSWRQGPIDYKAIPELASVELEKYRKKGSEVVTVRIAKPDEVDPLRI